MASVEVKSEDKTEKMINTVDGLESFKTNVVNDKTAKVMIKYKQKMSNKKLAVLLKLPQGIVIHPTQIHRSQTKQR